MVDEATCPQNVERKLVGMWPAFAIPFLADGG
jgi:hypothetical protein